MQNFDVWADLWLVKDPAGTTHIVRVAYRHWRETWCGARGKDDAYPWADGNSVESVTCQDCINRREVVHGPRQLAMFV